MYVRHDFVLFPDRNFFAIYFSLEDTSHSLKLIIEAKCGWAKCKIYIYISLKFYLHVPRENEWTIEG